MTTVVEVTYVTPFVEDIGRLQHVVERGVGLAEDDLAVLGTVQADVYVTGVELVVRVFGGYLPLGLGDTGPGVVQADFAGPAQTGGTNQFSVGIVVFTVSEIPSFLETQIIPSVRVYKRCCFR
ncbi:hypothetical protein KAM471c_26770 [Aeromonas caviae]|nr:hypothetical protein KAM471c_26770 [Aeromonas caviae]GKR38086.1 hypothetical protein KAM471_38500 [Aeromonas caviae]